MSKTLLELQEEIYQNNVDHGWWEGGANEKDIPEKLMLVVTELAEAMEEYRTHHDPRKSTT